MLSAYAFEQTLVYSSYQTQRQWKVSYPCQPVFEGPYVVDDFPYIGYLFFPQTGSLEVEQIRQGSLCAFDTAGQYCFSTDKGVNEKVGVRERPGNTGQLTEGSVGLGEHDRKRRVKETEGGNGSGT